jgi:hypothetical protein
VGEVKVKAQTFSHQLKVWAFLLSGETGGKNGRATTAQPILAHVDHFIANFGQ